MASRCSRLACSPRIGDAEQHGEQRGEEVAECGLDHPAVDDGPHVGRPVGREQQGSQREAEDHGAVAAHGEQHRPAAADGDDDGHDHAGQGDAPADELEGVESGERLPVDRQQAPQAVGDDGGADPAGHLGIGVVAVHGARRYGSRRHDPHNVVEARTVRAGGHHSRRGAAGGSDRRGPQALDGAVGDRRAHGGGDVADASPADRAGDGRGRAAGVRADVRQLRGADAAVVLPPGRAAAGQDERAADGPPGEHHQHRRPAGGARAWCAAGATRSTGGGCSPR